MYLALQRRRPSDQRNRGLGLDKHQLLAIYAHLFSHSMKRKWPNRVFIDLFAGSGVSRIKDTDQVVEASPLIALRVASPFTHHIFCDKDEKLLDALRVRVERLHPEAQVEYILGDVNEVVDQVADKIPPYSKESGTLSFCFADPYGMNSLRFETIQRLSRFYMDFLIHIPTSQLQRFWEAKYLEMEFGTAPPDIFLGSTDWRDRIMSKPQSKSVTCFH